MSGGPLRLVFFLIGARVPELTPGTICTTSEAFLMFELNTLEREAVELTSQTLKKKIPQIL